MTDVPTLYVRDIPPGLYNQLKRWAKQSKRSVNAEVVALLEQEAERRKNSSNWFQELLEFRKQHTIPREDVDMMIQAIRDHRDGRDR
ncbi:MAG TPA: Arc family DNA-binding protein [Gaiellaceae bacterium]|nr:Arc family DNA-binding protein [Gaiellaceae bacterium]